MDPLSEAELRRLCQAATTSAVLGFIADLYAAQGWTVATIDAKEGTLTLERNDYQQRIGVATGTTVPDSVETVVVVGSEFDPTEITADTRVDIGDLRNRLLYSIDREQAADILERRFDKPFSVSVDASSAAESQSETERDTVSDSTSKAELDAAGRASAVPTASHQHASDNTQASTSSILADRRHLGLAGGLVLLAAVLVVIGTMGFPVADAGVDPATAPETTPVPVTATPSTGVQEATGSDRPVSAQPTQIATRAATYPPGVNRSGITAYQRLVSAHESQLANRSHRVTLVYREVKNGTVTGGTTQTVRVENETTYYATATEFGNTESFTPSFTDGTVYANGSVEFERTATGVTRRSPRGAAQFQTALSRYLGWYLSVEDSRIISTTPDGNPSTVSIAMDGDPYPGVTNTTGAAVVTESGVVTQVHRTHSEPGSAVRIVITIRVSDIGTTTVSSPDWADDA